MSDTILTINEVTEQIAAIEGTPTTLETQAMPETIEDTPPPQDPPLEEGIEEELIIEDFTIDGICGVY